MPQSISQQGLELEGNGFVGAFGAEGPGKDELFDGPAPPVRYEAVAGPRGIALRDLDLDGDLDAIPVNSFEATVSVLRNQGDGTFLSHVPHAVGLDPVHAAVEDLDGDGDLDVAVANRGDDTVAVLFNPGGGALAAQLVHSVGTGLGPSPPPTWTATATAIWPSRTTGAMTSRS